MMPGAEQAPVRRRIPLWVTLIPLAAGIAIWGWLWQGHEARLKADLAQVLPTGTKLETGGFPYRLEARIEPADILFDDVALSASAKAAVVKMSGLISRIWLTMAASPTPGKMKTLLP